MSKLSKFLFESSCCKKAKLFDKRDSSRLSSVTARKSQSRGGRLSFKRQIGTLNKTAPNAKFEASEKMMFMLSCLGLLIIRFTRFCLRRMKFSSASVSHNNFPFPNFLFKTAIAWPPFNPIKFFIKFTDPSNVWSSLVFLGDGIF